jgi:hypothetical protein
VVSGSWLADIEAILFTLFSFLFLALAAKQGAMDVLNQILEFDVARLLHHFDRFLSHKAE